MLLDNCLSINWRSIDGIWNVLIITIISLFDVDLPVLTQNKEKFEEIGTTVVISDKKVINICNDKWLTYQFLLKNGFYVPKTFISLEKALVNVNNEQISYPLIVKPRWGMGSIAVFEAENEEELKVFYEKTKRNILKTYLKYESQEDIDTSVLIQEKINGQEYGLDIINDLYGNYQTTIAKVKYAKRSGETDCAVTIADNRLKALGKKLSSCLHHVANLDVDVFIVDDKPYVLEMNARFVGGYPFSHMTGVNLPLAIVNWLQNISFDKKLLTERINIMGQKDINLVRLHIKPEVSINKIRTEEQIYRTVIEMQTLLTPSLTERKIDLQSYSKKLCYYGEVWRIQDTQNRIIGILAAYMNDK